MLLFWNSPLEQFNLVAFGPSWWGCYFFSNFFFTLVLISFFWLVLLAHSVTKSPLIGSSIFFFFSLYFSFCLTFVRENILKKMFFFFPYLFVLFSFLVSANLFSLVPFSFAVTSHISITLFLSFVIFFTCVVLALYRHGLEFFSLFLPSGAPFLLIPLLVGLELISYSARLFSLAIRLFANIMSGHTLLNILSGFAWLLFIKASFIGLFPFLVVFLVSFLEIGISVLQAYVFCVLSAIYLYEALVLH